MRKVLYTLLASCLLLGCGEVPDFIQFTPVNDHLWNSNEPVEFLIENSDTISKKNVFINIRNNKNYEFSTLFLISKIEFPDGTKVVDTLEYEMTDPEGNWLGSGYTDIKENKLSYKEDVVFETSGIYKFTIQHATRSINDVEGNESLKGITDVGLSIENTSK